MDGTSRPGPRLAGQEYGRIPFSYGRRQVKSRQYRPSRSYNDSYISYICNHDAESRSACIYVPPPFRILRSRQKSERRDPKLLNSAFFLDLSKKIMMDIYKRCQTVGVASTINRDQTFA
jgi:hypothetical protein